MADTPDGAQQYQNMIDSVGPDQAATWKAQSTQRMQESGIAPKDISDYWGDQAPYDTTGIANQVAGNLYQRQRCRGHWDRHGRRRPD